MEPLALGGTPRLIAGIILGIIGGFLIVKAGLPWRKNVQETFLFKDSGILKTFLFSITIGVPLFFFCKYIGIVESNFRPGFFWGSLTGGIFCGIGITVFRFMPSTAFAGLASGRVYAIWAIIGMFLALPVVKFISGVLSDSLYKWSSPVSFHRSLDAYGSAGAAILWVSVIALVLTILLQFTIGSGGEE